MLGSVLCFFIFLPCVPSPYQRTFSAQGQKKAHKHKQRENEAKKHKTLPNNFPGKNVFFKKKIGSDSRPPREKPPKPSKILFFSNLTSMIARRGQFFLRNRKRAPVRSFCTRFELRRILVAKVMSI